MTRELFGTDGVRGLAGKYPLDSEGAHQIGKAVGSLFAKEGETVIIGHDTRESSSQIVNDLIEGLISVGINVVNVGVITTPGLSYLTREGERFVAGIMVTASHNSYEYNGIKVFDSIGDKLSDEDEAILNKLIDSEITDRNKGSAGNEHHLVKDYEDFLVNASPGLKLNEFSIGIDTANGSASGIAERVFTRLGADVLPLFDRPNGRNINENCGATHPKALAHRVKTNKLSLGIALDGDADRVILIDSLGREVKGDYILYILATMRHEEAVVATVMSNLGFEQALNKRGIKLMRADVGDRYVLELLEDSGHNLGGEQSGHIIMRELLSNGDGLLSAIKLLEAVKVSGKDLEAWCDEITPVPQAMVNISLKDKELLKSDRVKDFIKEQTDKLGSEGRVLIRPSGTEPLARVMVEAEGAEDKAMQIANELKDLLESIGGEN